MALKRKILTGYGVSFALMGLVVAWAVLNLVRLGRASGAILQENYRSILAAESMIGAIERQDSASLLLLLGQGDVGRTQLRQGEAEFLQWLARAKDNVTIDGEAELIQAIDAGYARYLARVSALTGPAAGASAAANAYGDEIGPLFHQVRAACARLRHLNEDTMYAASLRAAQVADRAIWSTLGVAAAGLAVALVFSLLLAERLARPLRRVVDASRRLGAGDYAVQVPQEREDELGQLAGEFNQMAARLARYNELNIEQILSEKQKGEAILASIDDGVIVFDNDLLVTGANPAAQRILGLAEDGRARRCADILPGSPVCAAVQRAVASGTAPTLDEKDSVLRLEGRDGARHYQVSATTIPGRERRPAGVVLLLRDVTRLKEVDRLKSEFVMAASHELRTPLTSMGMGIDLLLEFAAPRLDERERSLLQAAHEEVGRLKALVTDLLELSRIEAGRIDMVFDRVDVSDLVARVQGIFGGQLEKEEVELRVHLDPGLPRIRADANKVMWVLTNLLSNALRYARGGGHIELTAHRVGPRVHLSVRDDGPGIPPEYQAAIFEKFVRVGGEGSGGTGLGLAICREIVRAHGGVIWVESTPGRGSTFTFTTPVAE